MNYKRKDKGTNKLLYLLVSVAGLAIIYLGFTKFHFLITILTFPIGLIMAISGYKNFKRAKFEIEELDFNEERLFIKFLNGETKEIKNSKLSYSILVKKFYKPIRAIEIIEKKKLGLLRGNSIGKIEIGKWENHLEPIAKHLIRQKYARKKWKFSWGIGDFLMIFSILLGLTEGLAGDYISDIDHSLSEATGSVGEIFSDERIRTIEESEIAEEKFLNKNK